MPSAMVRPAPGAGPRRGKGRPAVDPLQGTSTSEPCGGRVSFCETRRGGVDGDRQMVDFKGRVPACGDCGYGWGYSQDQAALSRTCTSLPPKTSIWWLAAYCSGMSTPGYAGNLGTGSPYTRRTGAFDISRSRMIDLLVDPTYVKAVVPVPDPGSAVRCGTASRHRPASDLGEGMGPDHTLLNVRARVARAFRNPPIPPSSYPPKRLNCLVNFTMNDRASVPLSMNRPPSGLSPSG